MNNLPSHVPLAALNLAQANAGALFANVTYAVLGLGVVIAVGWLAITKLRAWMREETEATEGFSLDELRRMHRGGEMTDEEYAKAQGAIIGAVRTREPRKDLRSKERERPVSAKQAAALGKLGTLGLNPSEVLALQREILAAPADATDSPPRTPPTSAPRGNLPRDKSPRPATPTTPPLAPPAPAISPVQPDSDRVVIRPRPLDGSPDAFRPKEPPKRPQGL